MNSHPSHRTPGSARIGWKNLARRRRQVVTDRRRRLTLERLEARELLAVYAVPANDLSHDGGAGLLGSYVNQSLRSYTTQDDWRVSQTISGTRVDATINFASNGWGLRSAVGVTGGSDSDWESFSVQWDGYLSITVAGTRVYTRSDDGSRLWIDLNNDSVFNSSGTELLNNGWGEGIARPATSASSVPLAVGTYRIRIQYEEGNGGNSMFLGWDDAAHSAGLVDSATILTEYGAIGSLGEVDQVPLSLQAGATLQVWPLNRSGTDMSYAPAVEILLADGTPLTGSFDGHSYEVTVPVTGSYAGRISSHFVQRGFTGDYTVSFRSTPFAGTAESESNDTRGTANPLTPATGFAGTLSSSSDVDYFRFPAAAGQAAVVKLAHRPEYNPAVRLLDGAGTVLATGLDGCGLAALVPNAGTYYLAIAADNAAGPVTGEYVGSLTLVDNTTLELPGGNALDNAAELPALGLHVVPGDHLQQAAGGASGLVGSYVNAWLGWRSTQDDWRNPASGVTISGTRADAIVNFTTATWGARAPVGITGGSDSDWELYSVQWDGWVSVATSGTRLYTRSDDGSRMWIDVNGDGQFASAGPEFIDNHFTSQQSATTGPASIPLDAGSYRIRLQYQEGYGGNEMYLLWDDARHSAGAMAGMVLAAAGRLSSLEDVDAFAVELVAGTAYQFQLTASGQTLATQDRRLAVCTEFGQALATGINGSVSVDIAQSRGGRHLLVVEAATTAGLGGYAVTVRATDSFPLQRDVPLYYFDFDGAGTYWGWQAAPFQRANAEAVIMGMFEGTLGVNDIDLTTTAPADGVERVAVAIGDVANPPWGGLGGGWRGTRRPSGAAICDVSGETGWTRLDNGSWAYNVSRHEAGHGTGVPHTRHSLDVMSYDNQLPLFPPGDMFPFGENPLPGRSIFRERDYLDWVTQAGRTVLEAEANDAGATAQDLDPYLTEMSGDSDARNDKAVVIGLIRGTADVDTYRFTATAGQAFSLDIDAAEFQNPLDATLTLSDAAGTVLAHSTDAVDPDTGLASVDPSLTFHFATAGTYYVQVAPTRGTWGNYRLKLAPARAWDTHAPRVLASWPDGGQSVEGTRQLLFWFNQPLDPATLTATNIEVRRQGGAVQSGAAWFDPTDATLVWLADAPLAVGTYTVTLRSGSTGLRDLTGNLLDGETSGTLGWPQISGDGTPGGDFVTTLTVTAADMTPAALNRVEYRRHSYNFGQFTLWFSDELDYTQFFSAPNLTVRNAGPDGLWATADDVLVPTKPAVDKVAAIGSPQLLLYTFGPLEPGLYRVEGSVVDATGANVAVSRVVAVGTSAVPADYLQPPSQTGQGLVGSYVNRSLRSRSTQDDWRSAGDLTISGTRTDAKLDFTTSTWGARAPVGVTGGSDANWETFSVQWDGWITVPTDGLHLFTRSDDGSRMWIDINQDGLFDSSGAEYVSNGWGNGQSVTLGPSSVALAAGSYRIRVQYEEGVGGNELQLLWDCEAADIAAGGVVRPTNIAALNVQPGTVLATPPERIEITFSGGLDVATLTPDNFRLRYSADPVFFDGDDQLLAEADGAVAWEPTRHRATWQPESPLAAGYYLIELNGHAGGLTDTFGRLLDGEYLDATIQGTTDRTVWQGSPSGDGLPGGDYRAYFAVPDKLPPTVTVTTLTTNDTTPAITGTVSEGTLQVAVHGKTYTAGDGNLSVSGTDWTLQIPAGDALPRGTYNVTATATDTAGNLGSDTTTEELRIVKLIVTSLTPSRSGFVARFSGEFQLDGLNLYDGAGGILGPADVMLKDSAGQVVAGTIVVDDSRQAIEFVKTGELLPPDTYAVTIKSGATALRDLDDDPLDGNQDGATGDDFMGQFTVTSSAARVLSIPDMARGAGQPVNVPNTASGLPIRIDNAAGVTSLAVDVVYDPALLNITAAWLAAGVPADWSVALDTPASGVAKIRAAGATALSGTNVEAVRLTAAVPSAAAYGAVQAIRLENVSLNGGSIAAVGDVAVHKAAYLGDTDGSGVHSSADAFLTVQAALGLASGFAAHSWADPRIVGDADGSGALSAADAFLIVQEGLGSVEPFIPDNPHITVTPVGGGVDPQFQIDVNLPASAGGLVTVPVNLHIEPAATNVGAFDFDLFFDPSQLTIQLPNGVSAGADTAGWAVSAVLVAPGQLRVGMVSQRGQPLAAGSREIARLQFRVQGGEAGRTGWQPVRDGLPTRPTLLPPMTDVSDGSPTRPTWLDIEPVDPRAGGFTWTDADGSVLIRPAVPALDGAARERVWREVDAKADLLESVPAELVHEIASVWR